MHKAYIMGLTLAMLFAIEACTPPDTVTAPSGEASPSTALSTATFINDLAYIQILVSGYSDDADPEMDGVALDIYFYNSKSESIMFQDVQVIVTIELYGYREILDTFDHEKMELVCQQQVTVDHSTKISEMFGKYIRIPFENIIIDHNSYYEFGTMKVTVETADQGNFQDIQDLVRLYPED